MEIAMIMGRAHWGKIGIYIVEALKMQSMPREREGNGILPAAGPWVLVWCCCGDC